ncbi:hypothetical protein PSYTB_17725 [Pseudomonas amygdali pv. tabaci str. ATCC 11528]|nr:hypothetical protein PSYTB_17725 [Pseudomonas amygdali pv. tabaci str. ATCC 11528]
MRDQSEQSPRSCFRPDFVGFLRPVTNVALCVVSAIAVKKQCAESGCCLTIVPTLRVGMQFVTLCVTRRFCGVR